MSTLTLISIVLGVVSVTFLVMLGVMGVVVHQRDHEIQRTLLWWIKCEKRLRGYRREKRGD